MPKVLYLTVHRPDRSPSQRFRFEQYIAYLKENGFDYHFSWLVNENDDQTFYAPGKIVGKSKILIRGILKRLSETIKANKYDIIFVQRESFMLGTAFFEKLFAKSRAKLIMDFDDSIWLQNVSAGNKKLAWLKNAEKTADIIKYADLIFAGNQYLADYARQFNSNVAIVPTTVDTDEYVKVQTTNDDGKICIGWSGSVTTIQHFEYALPFLRKLKAKYGERLTFKVIGDGNYKNEDLGIRGISWSKADEVRELSSFHIGIMPLPADEWTKGKCGLKGLQYMALEIPTIMANVGVNSQIIKEGQNGFLATTEDEWINKLETLINDPALRDRIGQAGRQTVIDHYSKNAWKSKYLEHFTNLAATQKKGSVVKG